MDLRAAHGIELDALCPEQHRIWIGLEERRVREMNGQPVQVDLALHDECLREEVVTHVRSVGVVGNRAQRVSELLSRGRVGGIRLNQHPEQFCGPAPLPLGKGFPGGAPNVFRAACELEHLLCALASRNPHQIDHIAAPPAAGFRVHPLRDPVELVIALLEVRTLREMLRKIRFHFPGGFVMPQSSIHRANRLVLHVLNQVAEVGQERGHPCAPGDRPKMPREQVLGGERAVEVERFEGFPGLTSMFESRRRDRGQHRVRGIPDHQNVFVR